MGRAWPGAKRRYRRRYFSILLSGNADRLALTHDVIDLSLAAAYDFELPEDLIAQVPAEPRDAARLLVLAGAENEDRTFAQLPDVLREDDLLVVNETRVIAARIFGTRIPSEGRVEILLLGPAGGRRYDPAASHWDVLLRPARRLPVGARIGFGDLGEARVTAIRDGGVREIAFDLDVPFEAFLSRAGRMPLPPYIHNASQSAQDRYQTIFARDPGSVAAPTASLHFTQDVFDALEKRGVRVVRLVLDVGLGTFRPMQTQRLDEHRMHSENYVLPQSTIDEIASARAAGRRVIAAGTTVMRALE
ncbi:MAG: S-adenosylmethionine:tRNA ribosyltransferase-isomerase, partial [Candidatus Eremiobacteraeota bacterium]|nr:S-adenosylmethionine:tRNA ribosyltransferase-isomerase [Candidatus Eremiobacteraeota bacterium]